ncbi:MAG TPA: hypothetical protein VHE55_05305 [Fimbriimonadaceae bacterium]|nr:hypothetical protein [Fimbriimonadaceae bacterium]
MEFCLFCRESSAPDTAREFLPPGWPYADRILSRNCSWFAIPGTGPQVFPYIIVASNRHITSLAETGGQERQALFHMLDLLLRLKLFPSNALTVFEHGGTSGDTCGCLDHCHIHVVDSEYPLQAILQKSAPDCRVECFSAERPLQAEGRYVCAGRYTGTGELVVAMSYDRGEIRQYFRKVLAALLRSEQWNWRERMNDDWLLRLVNAFDAKMASEEGLSKRRFGNWKDAPGS